jgi:DNA end-binding protein Ku
VPNKIKLALKLIESMRAEFDPARYHYTYTDDVQKLIEDKAKGQKPEATPNPDPSNVIDLVAALSGCQRVQRYAGRPPKFLRSTGSS